MVASPSADHLPPVCHVFNLGQKLDAMAGNLLSLTALSDEANAHHHIQLDCSELQHITNHGLRTILDVARQLHAEGRILSLCNLSAHATMIFQRSGLSALLPITPAASASLGQVLSLAA